MKASLEAIAYYLPEYSLDNDELHQLYPTWDVDKIAKKIGINSRRIAGENEFASDLAIKAAQNLFDEYQIDPGDVDFLLYCTQSPDYILPSTSCILQDQLNLPRTCGALDYSLGCSGYVNGLAMAKGLILGSIAKNVLLVTAETYSKYIHPKDRLNKIIFGDGATASLITAKDSGFILGEFCFGTDGRGAENLIVKAGGVRFKNVEACDVFDENNMFLRNDKYLYMNGSEIFKFTTEEVPEVIYKVLKKNGITIEEVDYFVLHQANKYMLEYIRKKIGIPEEKFIYYLENIGNTVSNSIPIAFKEECFSKKPGRILIVGFGVGYSLGACIINTVME